MPRPRIAPLFVSHGSPMTALTPGAAGAFWQSLGPAVDELAGGPPRAILALSAHTLTRTPTLLAAARHHAVHDFSGFPQALYQLRYSTAGAPDLAQQVARLLQAAGLPCQVLDQGGLDHGIWTPLRFAWPQASVPVLPLGFAPDWTPAQLFGLGQALAPLADEGVLVLATGSITHNLSLLFGRAGLPALDAPERPDSAAFRRWFAERALAADTQALLDYRRQAPHAAQMHPSDEHLLPWFVAAGAAGPGQPALRLHSSLTYGCLGLDAYAFGPAAPALRQALLSTPSPSNWAKPAPAA